MKKNVFIDMIKRRESNLFATNLPHSQRVNEKLEALKKIAQIGIYVKGPTLCTNE